jgi:HTH-type transcriptional regulator/antitoxin HigA
MEAMSALAANPAYTALLAKVPPRVIRTDEQNEAYLEALCEMEQRAAVWSEEEQELAAVLTVLIEDYEAKHFALPRASPREAIEFLMDQHGLKQKDLVDVFGTASIVSEVMRGRRELNKEHIRRLSERFGVSPELFF